MNLKWQKIPYKTASNMLFIFLILMTTACTGKRQPADPAPSKEETATLLQYLEENGNLLNSPALPALINADDLFRSLHAQNIHVIDVRPLDAYREGHIQHSINVRPSHILDHFEQVIDPRSFDFIVLVCENAMTSAYVHSVLLMLGYDNVLTLRFGLSSWDSAIAAGNWLGAMSSHLEGQLELTDNPKRSAGELPAIATGETNGYRILRARAQKVLQEHIPGNIITVNELMERPEDFYIINYWPRPLYEAGHLPGAIQYTPKSSLHSEEYIHTLPTDKPVVVYCFTGQHSAYVTPFLRMLGYDALNLPYGANTFIHTTMLTTQVSTRSFTEASIHQLPLVGKDHSEVALPEKEEEEVAVPIIGGC
ncbi:MAG: hypothetical protein EA394_07715 [Bacteroidia bacterium]|nr:MAG: hypothetical protein EA394_07715 [Bacteroidia bacterium]